ncbi:MAG: M48 family metalloprotease [Phycisphaerae bacterium]|nr:M48 family metalloprotease [Phycisphaerae bacterium]
MQVVVLAGLIASLAFLTEPLTELLRPPGDLTPVALLGYCLGAAVLTGANALAARRVLRRWGRMPQRALRRYGFVAACMHLWLIGGSVGVLTAGYGQWLLHIAWMRDVPLLRKLAAAGPFLVALIAVWAASYPFYRAFRRQGVSGAARVWSLREYLAYNIRHHLLFILVPVALILAGQDALELYARPNLPGARWADGVTFAAAVGWAGVVFYVSPVLLVRVWRTRPLGNSPVREALRAMSVRLGLRFRDVREWLSAGAVANAGVMGLTRHVRYVLLSDGLLDNMDSDEIKAIFAHEAGHIREHHIFYSVVFAISSLVLCSLAGPYLGWLLGATDVGAVLLTLALVVAVFAVGFGWVSRRFERQCDVTAAWAVGREYAAGGASSEGPPLGEPPLTEGVTAGDGIETAPAPDDPQRITPSGAAIFARALQHVARLNGMPTRRRNWRHGSIAARVSYILWLSTRGGTCREINRVVRHIKLGIWALAAGAAALTIVLW